MDKIEEVKTGAYCLICGKLKRVGLKQEVCMCPKPELDALPQYAKEAGYGTASRLPTVEEITAEEIVKLLERAATLFEQIQARKKKW